MTDRPKKVVLAYSGGLDTSIILKWLQTEYRAEVVTFTADLGQGEEVEPARAKAELLGIRPENIFIDDLREEFVRDYVFPMFRANTLYEGQYLLGTSIARPLIAKRQIEIARAVGADAVCHGATGKGNDQVRFEFGYYALEPDIRVIAPWREWDYASREQLIDFAEKHQIPISQGQERRSALLDRRQSAPLLVGREGARGPGRRGARICPPAHHLARGRARSGDNDRDRVRARRPGRDRRRNAVARHPARPTERSRPRQRHRPARSGREPLRRDEVARRLRDARRHHPARRPSRRRIDHARRRRRPSQGRDHAALREPHL